MHGYIFPKLLPAGIQKTHTHRKHSVREDNAHIIRFFCFRVKKMEKIDGFFNKTKAKCYIKFFFVSFWRNFISSSLLSAHYSLFSIYFLSSFLYHIWWCFVTKKWRGWLSKISGFFHLRQTRIHVVIWGGEVIHKQNVWINVFISFSIFWQSIIFRSLVLAL